MRKRQAWKVLKRLYLHDQICHKEKTIWQAAGVFLKLKKAPRPMWWKRYVTELCKHSFAREEHQ